MHGALSEKNSTVKLVLVVIMAELSSVQMPSIHSRCTEREADTKKNLRCNSAPQQTGWNVAVIVPRLPSPQLLLILYSYLVQYYSKRMTELATTSNENRMQQRIVNKLPTMSPHYEANSSQARK
jgi:hypothetical protein